MEGYSRIREWFEKDSRRLKLLKILYKVLPLCTAAIYIITAAVLLWRHDALLLKFLLYPCIVFVVTSIFRKIINRPRPYDGTNAVEPLVKKNKQGDSFPSRHALSAAVIAYACGVVSIPLGAAVSVLAVLISVTRVLAGVHYVSDVAGGLVIGYAACAVLFAVG